MNKVEKNIWVKFNNRHFNCGNMDRKTFISTKFKIPIEQLTCFKDEVNIKLVGGEDESVEYLSKDFKEFPIWEIANRRNNLIID